jgi:hypothetical protein
VATFEQGQAAEIGKGGVTAKDQQHIFYPAQRVIEKLIAKIGRDFLVLKDVAIKNGNRPYKPD